MADQIIQSSGLRWSTAQPSVLDVALDQAALAALHRSIERLHHNPAFDCRRLALPDDYLNGIRH